MIRHICDTTDLCSGCVWAVGWRTKSHGSFTNAFFPSICKREGERTLKQKCQTRPKSVTKKKSPHPCESCVTSCLVEGIPHLNVFLCFTSPCTTPALLITWHLLLRRWPLWSHHHKVCILTLCSEVELYCTCFLQRGDSSLWNHMACPPPPPHAPFSPQADGLSQLSCHCCHIQLLYARWARWCRTPVSFVLSRCFCLGHIKTLKLWWKPHCWSCWGMSGHAIETLEFVFHRGTTGAFLRYGYNWRTTCIN